LTMTLEGCKKSIKGEAQEETTEFIHRRVMHPRSIFPFCVKPRLCRGYFFVHREVIAGTVT
jgi:hypothetical protein